MLTDQELQSLRNLGNECEAAADEIVRYRAALEKRDKLIAAQQLEIADMKRIIENAVQQADMIQRLTVCIGGPLNDNVKRYTHDQMRDWQQVLDYARAITDKLDELNGVK